MDVNISGTNLEVGQPLISHITERINSTVEKYFGSAIDATVTVSREGPVFRVECSLHPTHGVNLHSHDEGMNVYETFDEAAQKLEKQLRRFKRRIKNHHDSTREAEIL